MIKTPQYVYIYMGDIWRSECFCCHFLLLPAQPPGCPYFNFHFFRFSLWLSGKFGPARIHWSRWAVRPATCNEIRLHMATACNSNSTICSAAPASELRRSSATEPINRSPLERETVHIHRNHKSVSSLPARLWHSSAPQVPEWFERSCEWPREPACPERQHDPPSGVTESRGKKKSRENGPNPNSTIDLEISAAWFWVIWGPQVWQPKSLALLTFALHVTAVLKATTAQFPIVTVEWFSLLLIPVEWFSLLLIPKDCLVEPCTAID